MGKVYKAVTFARKEEWTIEENKEGPVSRGLRHIYPPVIVETRVVLRKEKVSKVYKNKRVSTRRRELQEEREMLNIVRCVNFPDRVCLCEDGDKRKLVAESKMDFYCRHYRNWVKSRKGET